MDTRVAERILGVIREERDRRRRDLEVLAGEAHPYAADAADDKWTFVERPFINELCLLLLVWVRHEVERELVRTAARITSDGRELSPEEDRELIETWRRGLRGTDRKARSRVEEQRGREGWEQLNETLQLKQIGEWNGAMKTLQKMVNLYKHDPWATPRRDEMAR